MNNNYLPKREVSDQLVPWENTLMGALGINLTYASAERTTATMPVAGNVQPKGLLHGGASAALAETVGSIAAIHLAKDGQSIVGTDLSITHHRPVLTGIVSATAKLAYAGATTACYEIELMDQEERRFASARLTCRILENRQ